MTESRPFKRLTALLVMLFVITGTVIVPAADAQLEQSSQGAHVEQTSTDGCAPAHDHLRCELCRILRVAGSTSPAIAACVASAMRSSAFESREHLRASAFAGAAHHSRAPPAI